MSYTNVSWSIQKRTMVSKGEKTRRQNLVAGVAKWIEMNPMMLAILKNVNSWRDDMLILKKKDGNQIDYELPLH